MNVAGVFCALMVIPACFRPIYNHLACGPNGECPRGLTCSAQGICEREDPFGVDACTSFASQVDTCQPTFYGDLMLSGNMTYDTGLHELRVNGTLMTVAHMTLATQTGDVDAILVQNVRITSGAALRATGVLPFAIIASGSVTLEDSAEIDVSVGGAGAQTSCANPPIPGADNVGGAAGGGGGGYGAAGGNGGNGNANGTQSTGGAGGGAIAMPAGPRGGCPGARGGAGSAPGGIGGVGGLGGGALYIAAADRIDLGNIAVLTAGGGGGHGGGQSASSGDAGGGGGGSGGMIFLEAAHVMMAQTARVAANGGGGGEGSDLTARGTDGNAGLTSTSRASGGTNGATGGADGGRGGSAGLPSGETVIELPTGGGGGGGGGVGFIHIVSPDQKLGSVSPAAQ